MFDDACRCGDVRERRGDDFPRDFEERMAI